MKQLIVLIFVTTSITLSFSAFQYPSVRRDESISENHFGVQVKDPYRWLEDPDSTETEKFVENQNAVTRPYIDSNKDRDAIKNSFTNLYNYAKYGVPSKHGSKYYFSMNTGLQDQSIIYSLDSLQSEPKVFIDPNKLSSDGSVSLQWLKYSKNGQYCAYATSKGGSDWMTIKVKNVATGQDLSDTLTKVKFSAAEWTHDNLGFFYAQFDEYTGNGDGTDTEVPLNQKIFYHRINSAQSSDVMIAKFPAFPKYILGTPYLSDDGNYIHLFPSEGTSNSAWYWANIKDNPLTSQVTMSSVTVHQDAEYYFVGSDANNAYVRTNKGAPFFRLVKVDLNNPAESNWVTLIQDHNAVLDNVITVNKNYFAVVFMRDVVNSISIYRISDGSKVADVITPIGTVSQINGNRDDNEMFYKITSFLMPGIVYHYDFSTEPNKITIFKESKIPGFDPTEYTIEQVFFRSKDNTVNVPMFIVHHNGLKLDRSNPAFLYSYGGFNINIMPSYEPLAAFFIKDLKGIYALANIRGGGEYGDPWHEAGMLLKKQNVFDDFASAAEYLINKNYTTRDKLTINGRSNGGLLAGASANQRVDIYGCSIAEVGVMDMLRFHKFTIGYAWIEEYGNPEEETHFKNIIKYSPLHNIPTGTTQYPAMLVMTADHDDRVVPAHSLKFIAELQYRLGTKFPNTPLMIRVDTNSGHGSGKPISKWIEEKTDVVSFIINSLKLNYNPSKMGEPPVNGGIKSYIYNF